MSSRNSSRVSIRSLTTIKIMNKPINRIYYIQAHLPGNGLSTVRSTDQYLPAIIQKMLTESDAQLQEIWSVLHSHVQRSLFQRKIAKFPGSSFNTALDN